MMNTADHMDVLKLVTPLYAALFGPALADMSHNALKRWKDT